MVTIRYSLTPEDLAELEAERRGGPLQKLLRIPFRGLFASIGVIVIWQAFFFFPWKSGNLVIAAGGLVCLWGGLEMPGLAWLLQRMSDPHANRELNVYEGKIAELSRGKLRQFRWVPKRGFKENGNFFFLQAFRSDAKWAIPKRALTPDQEHGLRALVQLEPVDGAPIECRFFLTQDDLNEASAAGHRWLSSRYGKILSRAALALSTLVIPWILRRMGKSWAEEFKTEPLLAAGLVGLELFYIWAATGCVGLKALNRFDLERRIRISDLEVEVTRGAKTSTHPWKRFFSYQETQNLFLLRSQIVAQFWTIPKRALQPGDENKLRALLDRKLPEQKV